MCVASTSCELVSIQTLIKRLLTLTRSSVTPVEWCCVRRVPEPVVRVMVEAGTQEEADQICSELAETVKMSLAL